MLITTHYAPRSGFAAIIHDDDDAFLRRIPRCADRTNFMRQLAREGIDAPKILQVVKVMTDRPMQRTRIRL